MAKEKEKEDRIFLQWAIQLPAMAMMEEPMSFEDYKDRVLGANIDMRSTSQIMSELDEVEREIGVITDGNGDI